MTAAERIQHVSKKRKHLKSEWVLCMICLGSLALDSFLENGMYEYEILNEIFLFGNSLSFNLQLVLNKAYLVID